MRERAPVSSSSAGHADLISPPHLQQHLTSPPSQPPPPTLSPRTCCQAPATCRLCRRHRAQADQWRCLLPILAAQIRQRIRKRKQLSSKFKVFAFNLFSLGDFRVFIEILQRFGNVSEEIRRVRAQMEEDEQLATLMRGLRGQNLRDSQFADENVQLRLVEV